MEKRYDHISCDEQVRKLWQEQQIYRQQKAEYKPYTIDTPPPTVSGSLHIGHIFSYTQTDIIARYKRMTGHNVFYPFGFDCNGLPTERFVEKKYKTHVGKIGREKFIELCLETTKEMETKFVELWQNMGLSAEFEKTYSTISKTVQKISQESFIKLVRDDYAYIKKEPALYCTKCRTTVAQAELDDIEENTLFNDLQFTTTDGEKIVIATTRPELLPSCVAVLYHPDDVRYKHLENKKAVTPLFNKEVPLLADDLVLQEKGSGLVMVCTFGDKTDIEWFKKHKLPFEQSIGFDGKMVERAGELAGLNIKDARKKVLELLQEAHLLLEQKQISHAVNVHERCKHPIEYAILPQWFIKVVEHKEQFLKLADQINWYPQHMKSRYIDWVKNLSWDWCISRQRVYGIPFPVWYCDDCHQVLTAKEEDLPIDPQHTPYSGPCPQCNGNNIRPEKDVMDTWNTSSLTPYICKELFYDKKESPFKDNTFVPMSMRPQAHDIIRTWAFYTIVKTWMHSKRLAWNDIVISGYVLSEQKEKISKSKNNAPTEPEKLLEQFSPDAIRFWTASGTLGQDIAFSPDQIKIGQKLLTKLWNACKFASMNLQEYSHSEEQPKSLNVVNQWMLDATNSCLDKFHSYFEQQEFGLALQAVEHLFWHDFCDNYLEIIKDQFFNPDKYNKAEVQATLWTLYSTMLKILQLYAPYLPHITEYLYQQVFAQSQQEKSIHLMQLPLAGKIDEKNEELMKIILELISQVRKLKTEQQLSLKTELTSLTIFIADDVMKQMLLNHENIIKGVCKATEMKFSDEEVVTELKQYGETWSAVIGCY